MLFTEFNLEDAKKVWLEEGIEKGREEGIKSEKKTIAFALLDILDSETISEKTGLSIQEIEEMRKQ